MHIPVEHTYNVSNLLSKYMQLGGLHPGHLSNHQGEVLPLLLLYRVRICGVCIYTLCIAARVPHI